MTEDDYRAALRQRGYGQPIEKTWQAGLLNESHTHDAALFLLITDGEMTVTRDGNPRVCRPGDTIEVPAGALHDERVGANGVTFLVARK